jgi:drug/metabolite transporter (DMT)-like permease
MEDHAVGRFRHRHLGRRVRRRILAADNAPVSHPNSRISSHSAALALVIAASILWSLSGAFKGVLLEPTALHLNEPRVDPLHIAFYRALAAGLVLLPILRRPDVHFRPAMVGMVATFAAMNLMFVEALARGTAANAIFLQYTAPLWLYLAGLLWFGERPNRRSTAAVALGLLGVGVMVADGWQSENVAVVLLALGSGVAYAGVLIFLRVLRDESGAWLTVQNHFGAALVLLPLVASLPAPSSGQLAWLALFGAVQMGLPYLLMARGLRGVSAQEAGTLTLIEPLLNPLWAFFVVPGRERPTAATWVGGALILAGIACRYWPIGRQTRSSNTSSIE